MANGASCLGNEAKQSAPELCAACTWFLASTDGPEPPRERSAVSRYSLGVICSHHCSLSTPHHGHSLCEEQAVMTLPAAAVRCWQARSCVTSLTCWHAPPQPHSCPAHADRFDAQRCTAKLHCGGQGTHPAAVLLQGEVEVPQQPHEGGRELCQLVLPCRSVLGVSAKCASCKLEQQPEVRRALSLPCVAVHAAGPYQRSRQP